LLASFLKTQIAINLQTVFWISFSYEILANQSYTFKLKMIFWQGGLKLPDKVEELEGERERQGRNKKGKYNSYQVELKLISCFRRLFNSDKKTMIEKRKKLSLPFYKNKKVKSTKTNYPGKR
jgi:hypothetical protein